MSEVLERLGGEAKAGAFPMVEIDRLLFHERFNKRHFVLHHRLSDHPLFQLSRLIELARSTAATRARDLYYDAGVEDISQRWGTAPSAFSVDETIERIANAGAWIVLKRADIDPEYASLLARCMSDILEVSGRELERKMRRKEVIVFITSPQRLTTYHMDSETNFLLQVQGSKTMNVFPADDREVVPELEIEEFYSIDSNSATYKPHLQDRAEVLLMKPGMGVHIPVHSPHWLQNGDNISVSVSINYHSYDSERACLYRTNHYLRKFGLTPTPPFKSPMRDAVKRPIGMLAGVVRDAVRGPIRNK
jgi:hypothetical protein